MRDYTDLEDKAQRAVGSSDLRLAPDVVLEMIAEIKALRAKTETWCSYGDESAEHTFYGDQASIEPLGKIIFELEELREQKS